MFSPLSAVYPNCALYITPPSVHLCDYDCFWVLSGISFIITARSFIEILMNELSVHVWPWVNNELTLLKYRERERE